MEYVPLKVIFLLLLLLKTTDQGIEATHSKLDTFLRVHGYLRKNVENISSGESLFNGVLAWNSYVLGDKNTTT